MPVAGGMVNVMLEVQEKKATPVDLYGPLRDYIALNYSEREAQRLEDDLQAVRRMRSDLEKASPSEALPEVRRDLLQSYYRALCAIDSRFPISPDREHVNTLSFTWCDAFKPNKKASQQSIHLEKAAVLFNLGAVHSQMAFAADRTAAGGLKQACNSFQAAAGAFAFLRDKASLKASLGSSTTVDVSAECAGALERLMLAQAQECFFEKVISDAKAPGLCCKVARQVSLYYEEASAALNSPPLSQHFDRMWITHVQIKAAHFYAEACYRIALDLHEREEIAEEIARLKSAIGALNDSKKSARGVAAPLLDAVNDLEGCLNLNLERAMKENDRVYLMRVPPMSSLSPLPAASLVKSFPMADILDASKERLFATLVPDNSAKALSRYTQMVDDIIRIQAEKLQHGSEMARIRLKEMDLPHSILALDGIFSLPADIKEAVEAVLVVGGPAGLEAEFQQLRDLRRVNQEMLLQTEQILIKEEREDAELRSQFGTRWTRPQSSTLTKNLQDRLNKFAGNLKQAADSDALIERSIQDSSTLMAILNHRPIESALPRLEKPIMSLDGNEDAVVGALKQSLGHLETLGSQRASLEDMLKEIKRKDDILPKLMSVSGSYEDLFKKEIAKYDRICEEIDKNVEAQEQLLLQIQEQNDEFEKIFNLEDYKASCDRCHVQIATAVAKFREIKENINEGLKFYVTLQDAIANVKQQCSDFAMTRNIQCREMIDDVKGQMAGLSFSSSRPPGATRPSQPARPQSSPHPPPPPPEEQNPIFSRSYPLYPTSQLPPYGPPADTDAHHQRPPLYSDSTQQAGSHPPPSYTLPGGPYRHGSYSNMPGQ